MNPPVPGARGAPLLHLVEIHPVPPPDQPPGWLSEREGEVFAGLRIDKRRCDWVAGRRAAKGAVVAALTGWGPASGGAEGSGRQQEGDPPRRHPAPGAAPPPPPDPGAARIEILADPDGSPIPRLDGRRLLLGLSLSHSGTLAAALVVPPGHRCGCDLEQLQPRSDALVADHFTPDEIARVHAAPDRAAAILAANLVWSAKEAALKLLRTGLRRDTRSVEVEWRDEPGEDGWCPLRITQRGARDDGAGSVLEGWWLLLPGAVLTVTLWPADRPPRIPPRLPPH